MKTSTRAAVLATAGIVVAIAATITVVALQNPAPADPAPTAGATGNLVETDTHLLSEADGDVVLVEFADFECPACASAQSYLEQLQSEFAGEVTFAFRHFPLPQHLHAFEAAVASEAAARQGLFVEMHDALYTTQQQWASLDDASAFFRGLAEEIGLDLEQFDADIVDTRLHRSVEADADAGVQAGVRGTPTFFVDGELVELQSFDDLRNALVAATAD